MSLEIFPSSGFFFNFFLQWFIAFLNYIDKGIQWEGQETKWTQKKIQKNLSGLTLKEILAHSQQLSSGSSKGLSPECQCLAYQVVLIIGDNSGTVKGRRKKHNKAQMIAVVGNGAGTCQQPCSCCRFVLIWLIYRVVSQTTVCPYTDTCFFYYYSLIHMCIHCLGHFHPLPPPSSLLGRTCSALFSSSIEE
jgi:hypothetical protein